MPSLRKRATKAEPEPIAPPVLPADEALAAPPPGMSRDEAANILADAQASVGVAIAEHQDDDAHALRAQLAALRNAEQQAQRVLESQALLAANMGPRDTVPAIETGAQTQTARPQLTQAEMAVERVYPQLLTDPVLGRVASLTINELAERGVARGSPAYENQFGSAFANTLAQTKRAASPPPPPRSEPTPEPEPEPRIPMSAPVSRSVPVGDVSPTLPSKVTLSPQQREHARLCNVSEVDYARGVLKMNQMKQAGFYSERDG